MNNIINSVAAVGIVFPHILFPLITDVSASEWSDNTYIAFDVSSRINADVDSNKTTISLFTGLDFVKVFSNNQGDWGTLIVQPYDKRTYYRSELVNNDITYANSSLQLVTGLPDKISVKVIFAESCLFKSSSLTPSDS
jgi:hypothetical protein